MARPELSTLVVGPIAHGKLCRRILGYIGEHRGYTWSCANVVALFWVPAGLRRSDVSQKQYLVRVIMSGRVECLIFIALNPYTIFIWP